MPTAEDMDNTSSESSSGDSFAHMSDSEFEYEIQNNWSMIFTDDNDSTDHDVRSTYSSSLDEGGNVLSESVDSEDSEAERPSLRASRDQVQCSNSTLKPVEESMELPIMNGEEDESERALASQDKAREVTQEDRFLDKLLGLYQESAEYVAGAVRPSEGDDDGSKPLWRHPVSSLVLALLSLIAAGAISGSYFYSDSSTAIALPEPVEPLEPVTIIRYAVKTETHVVVAPTTLVETVWETTTEFAPEETGDIPSWELAKKFYFNFVQDSKDLSGAAWEKAQEIGEQAVQGAKDAAQDLKKSEFSEKVAALSREAVKKVEEGVAALTNTDVEALTEKVSGTVEDVKKGGLAGLAKLQNTFVNAKEYIHEATLNAAKSAAKIQDDLVENPPTVLKHASDAAKSFQDLLTDVVVPHTQELMGQVIDDISDFYSIAWKRSKDDLTKLYQDPRWSQYKNGAVKGASVFVSSTSSKVMDVTKNTRKATSHIFWTIKDKATSDETAEAIKNTKDATYQKLSSLARGTEQQLVDAQREAHERLVVAQREAYKRLQAAQKSASTIWEKLSHKDKDGCRYGVFCGGRLHGKPFKHVVGKKLLHRPADSFGSNVYSYARGLFRA